MVVYCKKELVKIIILFLCKSFSFLDKKWKPVTDITITTNRSGKSNKSGKGSDSKNWRDDTVAKGA